MTSEEYVAPAGQTITIDPPRDGAKDPRWWVGCWNEDGSNHWHIPFLTKFAARAEFERWRT